MKVLMSGMSKNRGGKETYIVGITREMIRLGADVDFLSTDDPMAYEEEMLGLGCKVWHIPGRSVSLRGHNRAIRDIYAQRAYDVLWSHKTTLSSMGDLTIAKRAGIPVRIAHSHCTQNTGSQLTAVLHALHRHRVHRVATHLYACSEAAGEYFFTRRTPFVVKKNAFYLDRYAPNEAVREEYRRKLEVGESLVLGHAGLFAPVKNHAKLVEVFEEVLRLRPDAMLLLCGTGDLQEDIRLRVERAGIGQRVKFLGARDDVPAILQAIDVFVFPSLHEGLPYAPLEAQAVGVPCVISDAVPKEVVYGPHTVRIGVDEPSEAWARLCVELSCENRKTCIPAMKNDGLDITIEAAKIFGELQEYVNRVG